MKPEVLVPALFLIAVLSFFAPPVPAALRRLFARSRATVFAAPVALSAAFCAALWWRGVLNAPICLLIALYTLLPTVCAFPRREARRVSWIDFLIVLLLWLPIELNAGAPWVPGPARGYAHTAAYGVSIVLALVLFLGYRGMAGLKYSLPHGAKDFALPAGGFIVLAAILIPMGLALSFIAPFHIVKGFTWFWFVKRYFLILAGIALPEETLFRALIQNFLMQKFGENNRTLCVAAFIFGCAHLNNGPQALPNWRYMILATVAGFAYGKVFQRSSSVLSSAMLHALVDAVHHAFF